MYERMEGKDVIWSSDMAPLIKEQVLHNPGQAATCSDNEQQGNRVHAKMVVANVALYSPIKTVY
jgi:hypothetical protein